MLARIGGLALEQTLDRAAELIGFRGNSTRFGANRSVTLLGVALDSLCERLGVAACVFQLPLRVDRIIHVYSLLETFRIRFSARAGASRSRHSDRNGRSARDFARNAAPARRSGAENRGDRKAPPAGSKGPHSRNL